MRIKTDITVLGELLIDFTPAGVSQQGMRLFEQNPGGAPANLLAAAAKIWEGRQHLLARWVRICTVIS